LGTRKDGFEQHFLQKGDWFAIRIADGMLDEIKFIATYQTAPVSAITHYAPVAQIEPYGEGGKYRLVFAKTCPSPGHRLYPLCRRAGRCGGHATPALIS
jgi:hypothetical protein